MNNTGPYFVWTTKAFVSVAQAELINEQIEAIDPSMAFIRHYAAGNETHGWLERPNDGTNDYNHVRERSARCVKVAEWILRSSPKSEKKKAAR